MTHRRRTHPLIPDRRFLAILVAALLLAAPAVSVAAPPAPTSGEVRAAALEMLDATDDPVRAADYLVEAALRLDDRDPGKADNLRLAGRLYHHAGRLMDARLATLDAGVTAYRSGRAALAAHIFLDAAQVAVEAGSAHDAHEAAERAGWVLRNGDLSRTERLGVLERVVYGGQLEVRLEDPEVRG